MVSGSGRFLLSQKSFALFGNASIKAFWSAACLLLGDWIYLRCALYGMKDQKPLFMLLEIAEKPRIFGAPYPPPLSASLFFGTGLKDWFRLNRCSTQASSFSKINWGIIFSFGVWFIWTWRNHFIIRNERHPRNLRTEAISKATEFAFIGPNGKQTCA